MLISTKYVLCDFADNKKSRVFENCSYGWVLVMVHCFDWVGKGLFKKKPAEISQVDH